MFFYNFWVLLMWSHSILIIDYFRNCYVDIFTWIMLCLMKEAKFFEETCKDMIFVVGFILGFNLADTVPIRIGRGKLYEIGILTITLKWSDERFRKIWHPFWNLLTLLWKMQKLCYHSYLINSNCHFWNCKKNCTKTFFRT